MVRTALVALLGAALLATPGVRAKLDDEKAAADADTAEKIVALLHNGKLDYDKDLRTTPFKEVMDDLSRQYRVNIVLSKSALAVITDETKVDAFSATRLKGMSLRSFLNAYLGGLNTENLVYMVREDHIEITTREKQGLESGLQEAELAAGAEGSAEALARANLPIVSIVANKKPIGEVFDELSRVYGLNLTVNSDTIRAGGLKKEISVRLLNVPADTALELIAEQADLGAVRKGNTFRIISNGGA